MQVLTNGPDVTLLIWPTCEKEFEAKPEIRFRIDNKKIVEPGTRIEVGKLKEKDVWVHYEIVDILEVKQSISYLRQNIITAKVNRFVQ